MLRRICDNCRFWNNSVSHHDHDDSGRCTRHAPAVNQITGMGVWPFTDALDGCGEYQPIRKEKR